MEMRGYALFRHPIMLYRNFKFYGGGGAELDRPDLGLAG